MIPRIYSEEPFKLNDSELALAISDRYLAYGVNWLHPNIRTQDVYEEVLHGRIERVQEVPEFSSRLIVGRVLKEYNNTRGSKSSQVEDIDKLFNTRGQSAATEKFLKEMQLSRVEQILVLRGVVLATERRRLESESGDSRYRFSNRQEALNLAARTSIHNMATNPVRVSSNGEEDRIQRFMANYVTSYIAKIVEREVSVDEFSEVYDRSSIEGAMEVQIPFARFREKQPDRAVSIFTIEQYEQDDDPEPYGFRPVHRTEIDVSRLAGLAEVQSKLDDGKTAFTYFETFRPFEMVERPDDLPPKKPRINTPALPEVADDLEEEEYVILEIESRDSSGRAMTHVVAENNTVKNACFVLRQEVIDHWKDLLGVDFKWENILLSTKKGAEQMGARRMIHAKGSDVPRRVFDYLTADPDEAVLDAFGFLFDRKDNPRMTYFDDDMQPTKFNKLKPALIRKIQQSHELVELWPMIREHGYKKARTLLTRVEQASPEGTENTVKQDNQKKTADDKSSSTLDRPSTNYDDIWSSVIDEVLRDL